MSNRPSRDDARLRREFLAEAEVLLENATASLDELDSAGEDPPPETVNALFRAIHSLKGLSAMVGLGGISSAAHELESLLDALRMGRVPLDGISRGAAREGAGALAALVSAVAAGGENPAVPAGAVERIRSATRPRSPAAATSASRIPAELESLLTDYERHRLEEAFRKSRPLVLVDLDLPFETFDEGLRKGMTEAAAHGELIGTFPGNADDPNRMRFRLLVAIRDERTVDEVAASCGGTAGWSGGERPVSPGPPPPLPVRAQRTGSDPVTESITPSLATTIRLQVEKVERMVDLAAEVAVARGSLGRLLGRALESLGDRSLRYDLTRAFAQLDRSVTEIGRSALSLRLVPVDQLTKRLARTVQQLAAALEKEVAFEVFGGETELDKSLADALSDPLSHLVRNALDHGFEAPAERAAKGKPGLGRLTVTVSARGREVAFEIRDDGRGIDASALAGRARERGLLARSAPDPEDPLQLIFLPGFSTAAQVSSVSGRGVGLDVVRANIEGLRGRVSVRSVAGEGTTFEVVVPMTLALLETLVVRAGGLLFALPSESVVRTLEAGAGDIEMVDGVVCLRDGGRPLPSVRLAELFGLGAPDGGVAREAYLVAEDDGRRGAFGVGAVIGTQELVVKPLPDAIPRAPEISGVAEVPGGGLALALDTRRLLARLADRAPVPVRRDG